jgi:hypothetical protein
VVQHQNPGAVSIENNYGQTEIDFAASQKRPGLYTRSVSATCYCTKLIKRHQTQTVYEEIHEKVFYDSMRFWNDRDGIAIGDPTQDYLSILIRTTAETPGKNNPVLPYPKLRMEKQHLRPVIPISQ